MFKKKNTKVVLSNSTVTIFRIAQETISYISNNIPFEIIHATIQVRDLKYAPTAENNKNGIAELKVAYKNTTINFEIRVMIKKEKNLWGKLPTAEILFSDREDRASSLIQAEDGSLTTDDEFSEQHLKEIREMIGA